MSSEVPEGWSVKLLSELADLIMGQSPPSSAVSESGDGLPFIQGNAEFGARHPTPRFVASTTPKVVQEGDILISVRAPVGEVNIAESPLCIGRGVGGIRAKDCDSDFLFYAVGGLSQTFARLSQGSTFDAINGKELRSIEILLPTLEEQRQIAEMLRSVDETISTTVAVVERAEALHTGLLASLMTACAGGGDSETKLGEIVADPITYGVVQPGDYLDEGVLLVRGGDFPNGQIRIEGLPRVSPTVVRPYERSTLRGGELVISLVGYPGACAVVPETLAGANISRSAALVRPSEAIDRDYLYHFIRSPLGQTRLLVNSIGSAQQVVNLKDLREVRVPVPSRDRQREVVSVLHGSMQGVLAARRQLQGLNDLKAGLASDLLSGRVRVPT